MAPFRWTPCSTHIRTIVEASDLPVNADFQAGYADDAEQVGANVRRCVETGVAGLSIEDATGDPARPFYPRELAARRIAVARAAIDAAGGDVILVGRAEWKITNRDDLDETIARLRAYADAGADCLYAPGLATREQITAAVAAVAPKPLNVLVSKAGGLTVAEIAALGVRRVSLGSALARTAWGAFIRAASTIACAGSLRRPRRRRAVPGAERVLPGRRTATSAVVVLASSRGAM